MFCASVAVGTLTDVDVPHPEFHTRGDMPDAVETWNRYSGLFPVGSVNVPASFGVTLTDAPDAGELIAAVGRPAVVTYKLILTCLNVYVLLVSCPRNRLHRLALPPSSAHFAHCEASASPPSVPVLPTDTDVTAEPAAPSNDIAVAYPVYAGYALFVPDTTSTGIWIPVTCVPWNDE